MPPASNAASHAAPGTRRRFLRRFLRNKNGATAVEFALVALPFFALLYAVLETGLVFFAQEVLQTATTQASRAIMTGQAQTQNVSATTFQQSVCNAATSLFTCGSIYVNVQKFSSFTSASMMNPLSNGNFNNSMTYNTGGPGDIVVVQTFYQWPVFLGPLGFNLTNMNGNYRLLQATAVFRNEPY
jgi:Flp pilus assembly protein TadG